MDEWLAGSVIDQLDQWVMGERKRAFRASVRLSFPLFLELRREIIQVWISTHFASSSDHPWFTHLKTEVKKQLTWKKKNHKKMTKRSCVTLSGAHVRV